MLAAFLIFSVIASGPSALFGIELVSEEENNSKASSTDFPIGELSAGDYAMVKKTVVGIIAENGLVNKSKMFEQSVAFIRPTETAKVKDKGAN